MTSRQADTDIRREVRDHSVESARRAGERRADPKGDGVDLSRVDAIESAAVRFCAVARMARPSGRRSSMNHRMAASTLLWRKRRAVPAEG